ncbi:MAG: error-prone DNA polymerase [Cellvibrionaceae bacterium]|nr:error-prone DNA polymerase [Cellvibrionaceae bacterium]
MSYAELFCQSNFSFLHGASQPEELVRRAAFLGYQALAITDECSVAGVVRAHSCIEQEGLTLQLIIGSLFRYGDDLQLLLLCPNHAAYGELCRIISNARARSEKGQYQLDLWELRKLQHCLIIWLPCGTAASDDYWGKWLSQRYLGRLWLGLQRHLHSGEHHYRQHCEQLGEQWQIPICACGGVLMHSPERQNLQQLLSAIRLGKPIAQLGRGLSSNKEACLRSIDKLLSLFPEPYLLESLNIAARCQFNLGELKSLYQYPAELVPKDQSPGDYLRQLVKGGCQKRFPNGVSAEVQAIINKELKLIIEEKYEYFFLTIYDLVQFAQRNNILYQGRGSAANSVVCYCLEITAVNPEKISVLFERFISKERKEPPDIDVDFESQRREEVIQYIYQKYGRQRAALAATVITYRLRSALREAGKALGFAESQMDFFIKQINRRSPVPWPEQLQGAGLDLNSHQSQLLVNMVEQLRGFPRHLSQHVGGFVITSGPLYQLVPTENAAMPERTVIQWDKDDLETLGLFKVDVLSLGMLSAIRRSFALIENRHRRLLSIAQIGALPEDPDVYRMIQAADTVGVFQIESRAQMSMLPRLKPACYYDLVVEIAIVRPGPIQGEMVHPYLKRRNGEEAADYPSEDLRPVLKRTYGVPIFQEQVIQIAMVAAGFSGGQADQLRRAMASWKKTGQLHGFRQKLIDGMLKKGYQRDYAERIFAQILGFGDYGFPESHSASFAILAYVSAWLKYHYPLEFCCALLNSQPMGFYSPAQLINDARRHGVKVLPVCVKHSRWDHRPEADSLRLGLRLVKGLSQAGADTIAALQTSDQIEQFGKLQQQLNRRDLEALASANALGVFAGNRFQARWRSAERECELPLFAELETKQSEQSQLPYCPSDADNLLEDYASLGLSLDHHPIGLLRAQGHFGRCASSNQLADKRNNSLIRVVGLVTGRQSPGTASGVTFITLDDEHGQTNIITWAATAQAQQQAFLRAKILEVRGVLEKANGVVHVVAGKLIDHSQLLESLQAGSRDFH